MPSRMTTAHGFVFTSDAAGLPQASCYKCKIGVASVGEDPDGNLIFASRLWWEKQFIREKRDEKGVRFGDKSTTLEAVGLLIPLLSIPERLVNTHIRQHGMCLRVREQELHCG
jgi:hypothetical protein